MILKPAPHTNYCMFAHFKGVWHRNDNWIINSGGKIFKHGWGIWYQKLESQTNFVCSIWKGMKTMMNPSLKVTIQMKSGGKIFKHAWGEHSPEAHDTKTGTLHKLCFLILKGHEDVNESTNVIIKSDYSMKSGGMNFRLLTYHTKTGTAHKSLLILKGHGVESTNIKSDYSMKSS